MDVAGLYDTASYQLLKFLKESRVATGGHEGEPSAPTVRSRHASHAFCVQVVDKIAAVQTGSKCGHEDVPVEPVVLESVTLVKA